MRKADAALRRSRPDRSFLIYYKCDTSYQSIDALRWPLSDDLMHSNTLASLFWSLIQPPVFSFWGALAGAAIGFLGKKKQNQATSAQSQRQMDFQERMSSTAHQREVKDLRAAGLNPILSGTGGQGASSPGGSAAPQFDQGAAAMEGATSALNYKNMVANRNLTEAQETVASVQQQKLLQDKNTSKASEGNIKAQTKLLGLDVPGKEAEAGMYKSTGSFMKYLKGLGLDATSAKGLLQLLFRKGAK